MGQDSKIEWCDHTFNPWSGCTKVSPACEHCYAEVNCSVKMRGVEWGPNGNRIVKAESGWKEPGKWNMDAGRSVICDATTPDGRVHVRPKVFCASLADVFEDWTGVLLDAQKRTLYEVAGDWVGCDKPPPGQAGRLLRMDDVRRRLFSIIDHTPNLDWLLLTKRPENIAKKWAQNGTGPNVATHASGFVIRRNAWLGVTVEDRKHGVPRISTLRAIPASVRFLSVEPLLEDLGEINLDGIDWVIVGGESGPQARPVHPEWVCSVRDQCVAAGVAFFFKQWGEWMPYRAMTSSQAEAYYDPIPEGRPDDSIRRCRVKTVSLLSHPMPRGGSYDQFFKVGKEVAGRQLDGREWSEFPKVRS